MGGKTGEWAGKRGNLPNNGGFEGELMVSNRAGQCGKNEPGRPKCALKMAKIGPGPKGRLNGFNGI